MATTEEFSAIVRALNDVSSAGQARAAIGAALNAAHDAYKILPRLPEDREAAGRTELDQARISLQDYYADIKNVSAAAELRESFQGSGRKLVERVFIVIAGIEGEAGYKPQTSNLSIVVQSIREAPGVFVAAVGAVAKETGKVVGTVAKEAGAAAGSAVGGIFSGLGISGTLTLVIVAIVILLVVTRGTILGRIVSGGGT